MLRLTNKHTDGGKTAAISQRNDNNSQRAARSVISLPIVTEKSAILIILSYLPKPQPFLSAGPVAGASRVMGGTIWKSKILMANADLSRSCCSNQPAFSFTQLLVSREGGGVWLVRVRVHGWGGCGVACVLKHDWCFVWRLNTNEGFVKLQYLGPGRLAYGTRLIMHTPDWTESKEGGMCKLVAAAVFDFHRNGMGDTRKQEKRTWPPRALPM